MHGDELGAVGKYAFHLQDRQHRGDAGHHVGGGEDRGAERHQVGDAFAFARAFENFVGDDGDRLRMIELEPLGAAFARELGGGEYGETFKLGRRQQHRNPPQLANKRRWARACREAATSTQGMKLSISASGGTAAPPRRQWPAAGRRARPAPRPRRYGPAAPRRRSARTRSNSRRPGLRPFRSGRARARRNLAPAANGRGRCRLRSVNAIPRRLACRSRICAASKALPLRFDPLRKGSASVAASTAWSISASLSKSSPARCANATAMRSDVAQRCRKIMATTSCRPLRSSGASMAASPSMPLENAKLPLGKAESACCRIVSRSLTAGSRRPRRAKR